MTVIIAYGETVTKKPSGQPYKLPRFHMHGPSIDGLYTDPTHQVCRDLLKAGFDSATHVRFMREGTQVFLDAPIGEWAKWTLSESEKGGFSRRRFEEMPKDLHKEN